MELSDIITMPNRKNAFIALSKYYLNTRKDERQEIQSKWDFDVEWIYPDQFRLACQAGEQHSSLDRIEASLVYYSLESSDQNKRENLIAFCVIYNSCLFAGLNPEDIFNRVGKASGIEIESIFQSFLKRNAEDKSLDAFLLTSVKNKNGEIEIKTNWS